MTFQSFQQSTPSARFTFSENMQFFFELERIKENTIKKTFYLTANGSHFGLQPFQIKTLLKNKNKKNVIF